MECLDTLNQFRVVDAHAHNWNLFGDNTYLATCLDRFRLEGLVLLGNLTGGYDPSPDQVAASNQATAQACDQVDDRIIPFCYVNAAHTDHALIQIEKWHNQGFCGLKFWVSQRATDVRTWAVTEAALALGWPILLHSYYRTHGESPPRESPPMEITQLALRYPEGQFIMAHMGAQFEHGLRAVAECPNLAVDYAGSINEKGAYEMGLELLGPDRVIFGSDLPSADYYVNAGRVLELEVSDLVKQQIFADNILRILGRS